MSVCSNAKRGAVFSRHLAKADQQLPLVFFSNLTSVQKAMSTGCPQFSQAEGVLSYIGPLLGPCHDEVDHSNSKEVMSLGIGFWRGCFCVVKGSRRNLFLSRMGTALAQVPHSFFLLKLTLDTNFTAVGPQEVDEDVLPFRRVCGVPGRKVEVF